jgi:hypothetical protein
LTRIKQIIFGTSGATNQFGKIGSQSAGAAVTTKDLAAIQSLTQYQQGLYAITANAANPPYIQDLNSLYLLITSQIAYLFEKGIPEWEANTDYYNLLSFVQVNGVVYQAIQNQISAGPTGFPPASSPTYWRNVDPYTIGQSLATETARALAAEALLAPLASPALTGNPTAPTQTQGNNSTRIATTAYVDTGLALKAPLASPALTGTPTAPTQAAGDASTKIATTAYVDNARAIGYLFLTGSGNFTVPAGITQIVVTCIGGGGGGGGCSATASRAGGGGGGGGITKTILTVTPGQVIAYSCGTGGPGAAAGSNAGTAGNNTTFTGATTAGGGGGGGASTPGGAGGAMGTSNVPGSSPGGYGTGNGGAGIGGDGGGPGGLGGNGAAGSAATVAGGGGGGGGSNAVATAFAGGAGANGAIIVEW